MATCWKCQGKMTVPTTVASHGQSGVTTCPICFGKGYIGTPPLLPPCDKPRAEEKPTEKVEEKPSGFQSHTLLRAMTYTKCPICHGTRKLPNAFTTGTGKVIPAGSECLMCPPDGFVETGLIVGQTERERAEKEALLKVVVKIHDQLTGAAGKPNPEFALQVVENWLGDAIRLINKSDVSKARYELAKEERAGAKPPPSGKPTGG